ncbi:spore coat protein CotH [Xenorhabdus sp. PB62.4]|uniref:carbapenem self-resistance protein CarG family protein n=1 Tax=Xenorhabdus sp. PB62.4 TaxID=1851573 RepID=UPI001656B506|nr:spore coat protein CotH [Xenorhabdus sp. PB62.4]MBC8952721.1 hypothetical protein [Xenorhabdus sp. PB62.4]
MKVKKFFILLIFLSFNIFAHGSSKVVLKDGVNFIDLNGDGIKDIIFHAEFDNNTSHPNNTLTIFIKNKNGNYNIVPIPHDVGFTWFDFRLSASPIKITDYELRKEKGYYYMVIAHKIYDKLTNDNVFDELPVKFSRYDIKTNHEVPGVSIFYWDYTSFYITKNKYKSVDDAFIEFNLEGGL